MSRSTARAVLQLSYLELLRDERPDHEFTFLMGADVAAHLEQWRDPERVVELARLGIAARPGTALDEAEAAVERLGASGRADLIRMPEIVSSTQIRRRVAQGRPVSTSCRPRWRI